MIDLFAVRFLRHTTNKDRGQRVDGDDRVDITGERLRHVTKHTHNDHFSKKIKPRPAASHTPPLQPRRPLPDCYHRRPVRPPTGKEGRGCPTRGGRIQHAQIRSATTTNTTRPTPLQTRQIWHGERERARESMCCEERKPRRPRDLAMVSPLPPDLW
jgi:hypothetical protein